MPVADLQDAVTGLDVELVERDDRRREGEAEPGELVVPCYL